MRLALAKLLLAGAVMGAVCAITSRWLNAFGFAEKLDAALAVAVCVPGGVCVYFALLYLLRFKELDALKALLLRYFPKSK